MLVVYSWKPHHITSWWVRRLHIHCMSYTSYQHNYTFKQDYKVILKLSICQDIALLLVMTQLAEKAKNEALGRRWVSAVKRQKSNWNGPLADSQLCSKHFTEDYFIIEGVQFRDKMGISTLKCLKPDTVPTIFARSVDYLQASSSQSPTTGRPLSQRRQQRSVRAYI